MSSSVLPKKRLNTEGRQVVNGGRAVANSNRHVSGRIISQSRLVSNNARSLLQDDMAETSFDGESSIKFNENKHTILSNFEEWIKMSTDNKITIKNSWDFGLIDYFHDMNVMKDGEDINFQKASATLDGCVKIYSSRVESAATETGKLLSGLAKKNEDDKEGEVEEEEDNEQENDDDQDEAKKKRKYNKVVDSTLVKFDAIRIKKLDQELAIDPLFKKALAEFDEGGAKSLLLNTLNIDVSGRVVFDATSNPIKETEQIIEKENSTVDVSSLKNFLFPTDKEALENLTICPSLDEFHSALEDIKKAKSILGDFNSKMNESIPRPDYGFEEEFDNGNDNEPYNDDDGGFNDDIEPFNNDNEDVPGENTDPFNNLDQSLMQRLFHEQSESNIKSTKSVALMDRDLMEYFDERLKSNWQGPEHWKVTALKKSKKIESKDQPEHREVQISDPDSAETQAPQTKRKKAEQTEIDFFNEIDLDEDELFQPPKKPSSIKKKADLSHSDFVLPDDIKYNSSRLTNLFMKPQIPILYYPKKYEAVNSEPLTDEKFFAEQYKKHEEDEKERLANSFHQAEFDDYDNDYGNDIDFNDALEADIKESIPESHNNIMGKRRSEFVNFSRVAKRVDVKLLKDNLWEQIKDKENEIEFGQVVSNVSNMYTLDQAKDLSTSFCFICVLHLANEHGLTITSNDKHDNLVIGF